MFVARLKVCTYFADFGQSGVQAGKILVFGLLLIWFRRAAGP